MKRCPCTDREKSARDRDENPNLAGDICRAWRNSEERDSHSEPVSTLVILFNRHLLIAAVLLLPISSSLNERSVFADEPPPSDSTPSLLEPSLRSHPPAELSDADLPEPDTTDSRIANLEQEIRELRTNFDYQQVVPSALKDVGIDVGGAVRFQYSYEDYVRGNRRRGGDIDFDIFRIDFDGELGGVLLSAQYRWFQYMNVIHHAWAGYQFNEAWQAQVGITRVPFGNLPFNSHNFFFSSNYYVGLEDDYDAGIKLVGKNELHDLRIAFFKNDEMGGIDGFVDNRTDRYSYDVVGIRAPGEGIFDPPATELAEANGWAIRYTCHCCWSEVGGSFLAGQFRDRDGKRGDRWAYAIHSDTTIDRWNMKLQFTDYRYDVGGAGLLVVGAYSFYDTIPAQARLYTADLAYALPVDCGPVSELLFYNDFNVMTDKSGGLTENTYLNVTGVAVSAGGLYTYFDLLSAKNQPFVGGSMGSDSGNWNTRFNINVGYYF